MSDIFGIGWPRGLSEKSFSADLTVSKLSLRLNSSLQPNMGQLRETLGSQIRPAISYQLNKPFTKQAVSFNQSVIAMHASQMASSGSDATNAAITPLIIACEALVEVIEIIAHRRDQRRHSRWQSRSWQLQNGSS